MAAKRPAANANPADDLRLVPDANLPKLDTGLEHSRQILHQLAEVNSPIGGKIK